MKIALFNIRHTPLMTPWQVNHDFRFMADKVDANVYMLNEGTKAPFYDTLLRRQFPEKEGWEIFFKKNHIIVNTKMYDVRDTFKVDLSPTDPLIPQPKRTLTGVILDRKGQNKNKKRAVLCHHNTNGGFNNRHPRTKAERRKRWFGEIDGVRNVVDDLNDNGIPVWGGADFNRHNFDASQIHPNAKWLITEELMAMYFSAPKGTTVVRQETDVISQAQLKTDHPGLYVRAYTRRG